MSQKPSIRRPRAYNVVSSWIEPRVDLHQLRERYAACVSTRISDQGCSLRLDGRGENTLVLRYDGCSELTGDSSQRRCDFLVLHGGGPGAVLLAIELKGGDLDARQAADQLANGSVTLEALTEAGDKATFFPVLVHSGITTIEFRILRKLKVRHRGKDYPIATCRCGANVDYLARSG